MTDDPCDTQFGRAIDELLRLRVLVQEANDAAHLAHPDAFKHGGIVGTIEFLKARLELLEGVEAQLDAIRQGNCPHDHMITQGFRRHCSICGKTWTVERWGSR